MSLVSLHSVAVLTDLKNRGVGGVFFVVCDGLKGLAAGGDVVDVTLIVLLLTGWYTATRPRESFLTSTGPGS